MNPPQTGDKGLNSIVTFQSSFLQSMDAKANILFKGGMDKTKEEQSHKDYPVTFTADMTAFIDEIPALSTARGLLLEIRRELEDDLFKLMNSGNVNEFITNLKDLLKIDALSGLPGVCRSIFDMEISIALSFSSVLVGRGINLDAYEKSLKYYFFGEDGYNTVTGEMILPPRFSISQNNLQPRHLLKQVNAEQYIRDLTRIIVDTTGNELYGLRDRYEKLSKKYNQENNKKFVRWFGSFGDLAEASVLPVVENLITGVGNITLNPLIAAGTGIFCSTAARKATEHAYLELLGIRKHDGQG